MTAYANINFKTKKELKKAVKAWNETKHEFGDTEEHDDKVSNAVRCHQAGLGPDLSNFTGTVAISGPHYPAAHTWYAECELKDGIVIKVK